MFMFSWVIEIFQPDVFQLKNRKGNTKGLESLLISLYCSFFSTSIWSRQSPHIC